MDSLTKKQRSYCMSRIRSRNTKSELLLKKKLEEMRKEYLAAPEEAVAVIKGKKNFYKVVREMPAPKKAEYNIKFSVEINPEWIRELIQNRKRKVDVKTLVRYDNETEKNVLEWMKYTKQIKTIPNKGVAVSIVDDKIMFITMINSNTTILISDKATVELFNELFEKYYENAEGIEVRK